MNGSQPFVFKEDFLLFLEQFYWLIRILVRTGCCKCFGSDDRVHTEMILVSHISFPHSQSFPYPLSSTVHWDM